MDQNNARVTYQEHSMLKRKSEPLLIAKSIHPLVQLWTLRILIAVVSNRELANTQGFVSEKLARVLGLKHDADGHFTPANVGQLRCDLAEKLHALESAQGSVMGRRLYCHGLASLSAALGMSEVEADVLEFACASSMEVVLKEALARFEELDQHLAMDLVAEALGHDISDVKAALSRQGILARSGVLTFRTREFFRGDRMFELLNYDLPQLLQDEDTELDDVLGMVAHKTGPCGLTKGDYPHLQPELDHLIQYLRDATQQGLKGVNVLLYGPPGTGKSELGRVVACELAVSLYEVASMDSDGDPTTGTSRLKSLMLAQICLSKADNLLLFDEVEDVLTQRNSIIPANQPYRHKAWMNRQLESNAVPTFWVTNSLERMDPSMTRRFDVVLEVPVPPRAQREKIILAHTGSILDTGFLAVLADHTELAPAIVARAARVARVQHADGTGMPTVAETLLGLVNQTLKAQGLAAVVKPQPLELQHSYSLAHLNPDVPLEPLLAALQKAPTGRFCLFGPPGTGKTAFVRWVAQQLGRPLMVRRASDLMSKWVGGNEKNIAAAFTHASLDGAVLLIDEVDTFLQPRQNAVRGWEASMVNEMLTQMETFYGVFFATTNLMQRMDAAAMRRFDVKVHFRAPTATQLQALLAHVTQTMQLELPSLATCQQLAKLGITPGDLATVVRRARYVKPTTTAELLAAVEAEGQFKPEAGNYPIGFL